MKKYAERKNKIVVISLHQPGEALFNQFEDIFFMGVGVVFYSGEVNKMINWLDENGLQKPDGISLAEYIFELHSDNPYPRQIARSRLVVDHIIETNRQKYRELREGVELKKVSASPVITTSISFSHIKTLCRRFYLNNYRTRYLILSVSISTICLLGLGLLCLFILHRAIKLFAKKNGFDDGSLTENLEFMKKNMSNNGINLFINNSLIIFYTAMLMYFVGLFNYDFFEEKSYISDDILAGKYSIITAFLANLLHDIFSTSFWVLLPTPIIYLSSLRSIIPWTFLPILLLFSISYATGFMFLKLLFRGSKLLAMSVLIELMYVMGYSSIFSYDAIKIDKPVVIVGLSIPQTSAYCFRKLFLCIYCFIVDISS